MKIEVSELVVRFLQRLGIDTLFGIPGAHILPVYDRLYDADIEAVLVKHEQGAAFMAGGYARASGRIGACITTAGPGATNLVTGIANAYADKLPVLIITGETPTHIFGKGGLQESSGEGGSIDQVSLFKGITRYNRIVERTDYLPQVLNRAAKILRAPNSGPVLLSFPYNVQKELVEESMLDAVKIEPPRPAVGDTAAVKPLAEMLTAAEHPVIVAGYGCIAADAHAEVAALSDRLKIPVTTSLKAKGVIGERSPLALGSLGVTSSGHAYRYIMEQADLLLILGAGFNERTSYVWDAKLMEGKRVIQVDRDLEQLEKVFEADLAMEGDIKEVLTALLAHVSERNGDTFERRRAEIDRSRETVGSGYTLFQSGFSLVEHLFHRLEERFPEGAMVFDDNIIFAQNFFSVSSGNRYYPNSGISSLGHAIPAAIGARFTTPLGERRATFAVLGDGGFQMCCMELMTAVNYRIPLNVVLFNNASMGLIRKNQHQQYDGRYINCDFENPDFAQLAASFGVSHKRVERAEDVDALFADYDLTDGINLIEIVIDKNTFPNYSSRR